MKGIFGAIIFLVILLGANSTELSVKKCFPTGADVRCDLCEFVVSEVGFMVRQNKTESFIIYEMTKACDVFGKFSSECKKYIQLYGKKIIEMIINYGEDKVCFLLIWCKENGTPKCIICEIAVKMIDKLLKEKKTQDMIVKELEKFCHTIKIHEKECKSLVDAHTKELIDFIVKYGVDKACIYTKLCP